MGIVHAIPRVVEVDDLLETLPGRAVAGADPARLVPTCPEWTLAQLAAHVGAGHRLAATIVERRATTPVPNAEAGDLVLPRDPGGRTAWLLMGARRLSDAVRGVGPEAAVWTWSADRTAAASLGRTMTARADDFINRSHHVELVAGVALAVVLYLFAGFYASVIAATGACAQAARQLAEDDMPNFVERMRALSTRCP